MQKIISNTIISKTKIDPPLNNIKETRIEKVVVNIDGVILQYEAIVNIMTDNSAWARQISELEPSK